MITRESHSFHDHRCPIICKKFILMPYKKVTKDDGNWHDAIEFITIQKGSAILRYNQDEISVSEGDTVIINSNVIHTITANDATVEYICLIVDLNFCVQNYLDISTVSFERLVHDDRIAQILEEIHATHPSISGAVRFRSTTNIKDTDILLERRALTLQLLSRIYSNFRITQSELDNLNLNNGIKKALDFAFKEHHRVITLDEIAAVAGFNKHYFSREFRKVTGCSFVTYLNKLRCEKAATLLVSTKLPIKDIYAQCGFSEHSYFNRIFCKIYGISPLKYRKKNALPTAT
ncbi:MAG: helix-turn-helix transcriptional regulator [Clostridia bacterium]|nr:helix-turn-helix transcriptional regulator [Clostridia bacterium]